MGLLWRSTRDFPGGRMRTNATIPLTPAVAVIAEQPITILWPSTATQVKHDAGAAGTRSLSMSATVSIGVIQRQEFGLGLAAAFTHSAISRDHFRPDSIPASLAFSQLRFPIVAVIIAGTLATLLKFCRRELVSVATLTSSKGGHVGLPSLFTFRLPNLLRHFVLTSKPLFFTLDLFGRPFFSDRLLACFAHGFYAVKAADVSAKIARSYLFAFSAAIAGLYGHGES